jgi:probable rRNA maturation factor
MIFLDPDLDPDPASEFARSKRSAVPDRRASSGKQRVPSVRTLALFLRDAQSAARLRGRVSVLLTTDTTLRRLNRRFRGIDKSTDILSFPAEAFIQKQEKIVGDLAISVPTARRQSAEQGHPLGTELKVLILHGLLHLAGYDHEADSGQMARRERRLRADLGLPQSLIERAESNPPQERVGRTAGAPRPHRGKGGKARTQPRLISTRRKG